ncbi:MAG TPA: hypothetical protein VG900_03675 [Hyphomicrobiaceae bacterium]|nr:hypothetical protein [Hyphomicrobiaceae bacterium]
MLSFYIGSLALTGEVFVVLGMRWIGHPVLFTSFWALSMFSGMVGFLPSQPSPSRISTAPIGLAGRALLVIETGAFVAGAMFASSRFMAWRHIVMPVEIWFAAYAYVLILVVMLFANFSRLRREITASN